MMLFDIKKIENNNQSFIDPQINSELKKQIPVIKMGNTYHFPTDNKWSLHDIVCFCIESIGRCDLYFVTYAIKVYQAGLFAQMKERNLLNNIYAVIDYRASIYAPDALQILENITSELHFVRTHAKLIVLENELYQISIITSANFTTNTRNDVGVIVCDKSTAEFWKNWIKKLK